MHSSFLSTRHRITKPREGSKSTEEAELTKQWPPVEAGREQFLAASPELGQLPAKEQCLTTV